MRRGDKIMAAVTAAGSIMMIAGALLQQSGGKSAEGSKTAEILVNGKREYVIPLNRPRELRIETPEGFNIIRIDRGGAAIISADCPDGACMRMGRITKEGSGAVCLPHRVVVRIKGAGRSKVDSVSW